MEKVQQVLKRTDGQQRVNRYTLVFDFETS